MLDYRTKLYQLGALPLIQPGATQRLAIGAASAASSEIPGTIVRLVATVDCYVAIGANPVADTNSMFLPANFPEYFACAALDRVAALRVAADGALFITPAA